MNKAIQERIVFIENILRSNEAKNQPIYYTLKVERYGETSLLSERVKGAQEFIKDIYSCLKTHRPDQIIVELFSNKSKKVKTPVSTYQIQIDPRSLSGTDMEQKPPSPHYPQHNGQNTPIQDKGQYNTQKHVPQKPEEYISIQQYIQETLQAGKTQLDLEFQVRALDYESRQKEKTIQELKEQLEEREAEIQELEDELKTALEKQKQGGLGSIALETVGSHILENFFSSKTGQALAVSILGANAQKLSGLLGNTDTNTGTGGANQEEHSKASILNDQSTHHQSEKLDSFGLPVLRHLPRVDSMSIEQQQEYIQKTLQNSTPVLRLILCQLFAVLQHQQQLGIELTLFHSNLVERFNSMYTKGHTGMPHNQSPNEVRTQQHPASFKPAENGQSTLHYKETTETGKTGDADKDSEQEDADQEQDENDPV